MSYSPVLWRFTAREIQRRPGRTLLTLLGIVIGVASVVAINATTRATRRSYREMFEAVAGRASLEVAAPGQGGFDPAEVIRRLRKVEGVETAGGMIQTRAALLEESGVTPVLVLGVDADDVAGLARHRSQGRDLEPGRGVLLEENFARRRGLEVGSTVRLFTPSGPAQLAVAGLVEARGPALYSGGAVVLLPLADAQRLFGLPGQVNAVAIVLMDGADAAGVQERVRAVLPEGLVVQPVAAHAEIARDSLLSTDMALSSLSVVSLVGGAFVILNSFLMNLGERRRQLAILRALGTTRGQLARLLLREAVLLAGVGTLLGMGLGVLLALAMARMYETMLQVTLPPLRLTAEPFLLALAVGPGVALAATIGPALAAGRRAPLEAMQSRRTPADPVEGRPEWPALLGAVMLALGAVYVVGGVCRWWSLRWLTQTMAPAMVLILVGAVLSVPLVLRPLLALARRLLRPLFGTDSDLALRQLARQRTRTALTVGVLFIGVMMTIGFGTSTTNSIQDIDVWYRRTLPSDFLVRGVMPDSGTMLAAAMPRSTVDDVAGLTGVARPVVRTNFVPTRNGDRPVIAIGRDFPPGRALPMVLLEGDEDEVRAGLARGEVVVGSALAQRTGLGVGDALPLTTRQGERPLRIVGVVKEYTVGGMVVYLDWETADRLWSLPGVNAVETYALPGQHDRAASALREYCRSHGLQMQTNAELRAVVDEAVAAVEGFLWVLIALMLVVASLGIVNTLTMNVQEQTRELGVLRAIGMRRGQVRRLVLVQALALGILSVVPGVVMGCVLAFVMNLSTNPLVGHMIDFRLHGGFVAGCAVGAVVIAVPCALFPPAAPPASTSSRRCTMNEFPRT